jgi:hypothetical protein
VIHNGDIHEKMSKLIVVLKKSVLLRSPARYFMLQLLTHFIEFRAPTQLSAQEQKTRKTLKLT